MEKEFKVGDEVYVKAKITGFSENKTQNFNEYVLLKTGKTEVYYKINDIKIKKIKLKKNFTELEVGCYYRNVDGLLCGPMTTLHGKIFSDQHAWEYYKDGKMAFTYIKATNSEKTNFNLIEKVDIVRSKG